MLGRCDMRHTPELQIVIVIDIVTKTNHFRWWNVFDDMIIHFGLDLTQIDPLLTRICAKTTFTFSFPYRDHKVFSVSKQKLS